MHNATIIINQLVIVLATAMIIRWNSIIGTSYHGQSYYELTVYSLCILGLLIICCILAITRLIIFNREVSCCCKRFSDKED